MSDTNITYIIRQLVAGFPNTQVSKETIAVYIRLLSDIPAGDLQTVIDQAIAECKFLPTVAEIRERHRMLTIGLGQKASAEAWGDVLEQVRKVGHVGTPYFADELTGNVVQAMGWREICMSEKPGIERAQFMRMYDTLAERRTQVDRLLPQSRSLASQRLGMSSMAGLLGANDDSQH